jgi:hypothetical protein
MAPVFRRSLRAFVAGGVLLACPALIVSLPTSTRSEGSCSALRTWAQRYQGTAVTLDDLATLDRPHRIAAFNAVTPQVRATIAQDQLRRLRQRPDLSVAQRAFIDEGIALATPAFYEHDVAASAAVRNLWSRAGHAFTAAEDKRGWFDLGSVVAQPKTVAVQPTTRTSALDRLVNPFVASAQIDWCECSTVWQDCPHSGCVSSSCNWFVGCGPLWGYYCNGLCE